MPSRISLWLLSIGLIFAVLAGTGTAVEPPKIAIKPGNEGITIDAGSMGRFLLTYPALQKSGDKVAYKLIEKQPAGRQALLKYEGGAQVQLDVQPDHTIVLTFAGVPHDVKQFRMEMHIDFNYAQGGTYKIGRGTEQPFPAQKPPKPFLFQGNVDTITLKNVEGKALTFQVPQWSFMQLQDNREWNWSIFDWWFGAPYNPNQKVYRVKITPGAGDSAGPKLLVDQFGQSTTAEYPDKVKNLTELKGDVEAEKEYLAALAPPAWDPYGGLPNSGAQYGLKKTGFFHVEKKASRWILVDPAGNAFFHLGICGFQPSDDYTYVQGREGIYEWIPPFDGEFKTAFRLNDRNVISFQVANTIRKYGAPYEINSYLSRMIARVRKWGFNSVGAFSQVGQPAHKEAQFPYVGHLPLSVWEGLPEIPGAPGSWDPFDEKNRRKVESLFAEKLPPRADDPLLIGYFLVNEPLYEDLPRAVCALSGKFACKRRLVQMLQEKYQGIDRLNQAWGAAAKGFEELNDRGLAVSTAQAAEDVNHFTALLLETYFQLVADTFHKYDKNHLLLGNRFQSGTINNEQLCRICGRYVDIVSFNYYTYHLDKDFLNRIYEWTGGKPMFLSEFYFNSANDSGLIGGGKQVDSQLERGLGYRNYVEQAASLGYVVGIEWFTLVDQSITGRWFSYYNGENGNTGLVAVTDRPWKTMLAEMMKTNYAIYDVFFGRRAPFVYDNPKFTQAGGGRKTVTIQRAVGPITLDGSGRNWPGVPAEQIPAARLVEGSNNAGVEAVFKLCWDAKNLYVLARVTDPTPMKNDHTGNTIWSGDAIELFIGSEKPEQPGTLLFSDRQVLLSAGRVDDQCHCYFGNSPKQYTVPMTVLPTVDGKGYTLEAAIPFESLGFEPKEAQQILFDMAIDDSENGTGRARQLVWNGTNRNSGDRTAWGRATFAK
jgi:hypothetical protein